MRTKVVVWTAHINYRNSNNPDFEISFAVKGNHGPEFATIKKLWDERNNNCPLHKNAKEGIWYLLRLEKHTYPILENVEEEKSVHT